MEAEAKFGWRLRMPEAGDVVGRFVLGPSLGRGGMAAVFAAVERGALGRKVACKVLLPHLSAEPNFRAMFVAEARFLSQLSDPHIPTLYDAGEDNGVSFMAMELLEGFTLDALMRAGQPPALPVALAILQQLAEALAATHQAVGGDGNPLGIVHRDVSPQNIHVGIRGMVKLLDFGIAASNDRHRYTRTGELRGKLQYLAPEQITRSHKVSSHADVWAWGVVARELLAGETVFLDESEASTLWNVTSRTLLPTAEVAPSLPAGFAHLLDRCLCRDPDQRPPASELARAVTELLQPNAREQVQAWVQAHAAALKELGAQASAPDRGAEFPPSQQVAKPSLLSPSKWRGWRAPLGMSVGVMSLAFVASGLWSSCSPSAANAPRAENITWRGAVATAEESAQTAPSQVVTASLPESSSADGLRSKPASPRRAKARDRTLMRSAVAQAPQATNANEPSPRASNLPPVHTGRLLTARDPALLPTPTSGLLANPYSR